MKHIRRNRGIEVWKEVWIRYLSTYSRVYLIDAAEPIVRIYYKKDVGIW